MVQNYHFENAKLSLKPFCYGLLSEINAVLPLKQLKRLSDYDLHKVSKEPSEKFSEASIPIVALPSHLVS